MEELESPTSASGGHHRKQLRWHERKVSSGPAVNPDHTEDVRGEWMFISLAFFFPPNRMIDREFKRDYSYLSQAASVCEETQLTCPSRLIDVFSDTAVITFPSGSLVSLPQATWTEAPEPQYQHCPDLEIVLREPHS